ncbi:tyrosine-type recombinase/integrase [Methylobacter tundripaludum]|uniref:Phage integrase n=1 Tax=Methylobacter tundripaludum (strain ATCC BAA-1195 / DSM 17260 / SV96) TaxID=697282 RepID=G3IUH9_METTV|nr:tyrosine-type recombinase/integrase [Methylobacter tundripaludum]EGW21589.1 phage integrase [Methylobacter tundripaludum SV96]
MAIRRNRIDRTVSLTVSDDNRVVDIPPEWTFTIRCSKNGVEYPFDFNRYQSSGREPLAIQMRDAIWSMRRELTGKSLTSYVNSGILPFWRFLDDLEAFGELVSRLDQIDRRLMLRFISWMEKQIVVVGKNKGKPWSLASQRSAYYNMKAILVNRQRFVPSLVGPNLTFQKNPYPNSNRKIPRREEYSASEQGRLLAACRADLALFQGNEAVLPSHQVLTVHALITVLLCGINMTPLLEMTRDGLRPFLPDRDLLIFTKRRGYTTHALSLPRQERDNDEAKVIPRTAGDYLRQLQRYTEKFVMEAEANDRNCLFLCRLREDSYTDRRGSVVRFDVVQARNAIKRFVERHELRNDRGDPLKLSLSHLRPTFAMNLYRRTRDVRKVQKALGHASPVLTVQRYLPPVMPEVERNHAFVGQAMVGWATSKDPTHAVKLAADGKIPLQNATEILAGGYNTAVARCQNPFREGDSVCGKYLSCFKCPSMIVFEDDLYRLFSFYYRLLIERPKIPPHQWMKTYGWVVKTIDEQIVVQFDTPVVADARKRAIDSPHPAWAYGGSL